MKTNKVKFWVPEIDAFLVYTFAKEYEEEDVIEAINGYYHDWLHPEDFDDDFEAEVDNAHVDDWISEHMCNDGNFEVEDNDVVYVDKRMANVINWLESTISELKGYTEDDDHDDCETHDCWEAIESYELVLKVIKKQY